MTYDKTNEVFKKLLNKLTRSGRSLLLALVNRYCKIQLLKINCKYTVNRDLSVRHCKDLPVLFANEYIRTYDNYDTSEATDSNYEKKHKLCHNFIFLDD